MYLDFDNVEANNVVVDRSKHGNNAALLKGAALSSRKLGEFLVLGVLVNYVYRKYQGSFHQVYQ